MKTNSEKTANAAKSVESMRLELEKCQRELKACQERINQMKVLSARENSERQQTEEKLNRLNVELAQQAGELKAVNQTLLVSEQRLRIAIETGRIGLFVWDSTQLTNPGDWSNQLKEIFGLPLDADVTHDMFLKCVHPEDREHIDQCVMNALKGENGGEYKTEYRTIRPDDGLEHWVAARGQAFFNSEGKAIRFIGTVMDITERKRAEQFLSRANAELEERISQRLADFSRTNQALQNEIAERKQFEDKLRQSQAYLAEAQKLSLTGSFGWNVSTDEIIWSNETYCIFEFEVEQKPTLELVFERVHPEDVALVRETLDHATQNEISFDFEHRLLMPNGSVKHLHVVSRPSKNISGDVEFVGAVMDITRQKRLENRLRQSEQNLAEGQRLTKTGSWILDFKTGNTDWSVETCRIFGFPDPPPSPHYSEFRARVRPEDRERVDQGLRESFETGEPQPLKYIFILPDGTRKNIETISQPVRDDKGKLMLIGTVMDVTERVKVQEALQKSEAYLTEAQRLSRTGSFSWKPASGEVLWSAEMFRIFGFNPSVRPSLELARQRIHPDDAGIFAEKVRSGMQAGKDLEYEHRLLMPDGTVKWLQVVARASRDESDEVEYIGALMDITERAEAAEALRASEHLARGQLEALKKTLDVLAHESEPEKFLEQVLRTIAEQLSAHSIGVWEMSKSTGGTAFLANYENDLLQVAAGEDEPPSKDFLWERDHPVWSQFFHDGKFCVVSKLDTVPPQVRPENDEDGPWHDWQPDPASYPRLTTMMKRLLDSGIIGALCVPLFVTGIVTGLISVRFKQRRTFRREEIELARALSHQAMLAIQLVRLSQQSRQAAVIAERNRMARDIHDTLAQGFTGVIMQLEAAKGATKQGKLAEAANRIERASDLARSSLGEARRSVRALRPRSLRSGKLFLALDDLLKRMAEGTNLNAEFQAEGDEQSIPPDYEEGLLRITQEALTNAVKHAKARNFKATLSIGADRIQLRLVDDGCGFDPQKEHDGFGLIGMKERVDRMGGEFIIRTKQSVGTEILVVLKPQFALNPENGNE